MLIKKIIATAIIGLGIAGAFLIFQQSAPSLLEDEPLSKQSEGQNNNLVSQNPLIKTGETKSQTGQNINQNANQNLTELLTKQIGKKIVEENPSGPETIDNQQWMSVPDPESLTQDLLKEASEKFDPNSLKPIIKDSDLKISQNNSKEALTSYILNFQKIVQEAADKMPVDLFSKELALADIIQLADIYTEAVAKFYKLTVPSLALPIHKKQIELLTIKRNIFEKIRNYQEDPMTTILAIQELEKNDSEFNSLNETLKNFVQKNNLNS